ncbi:hypothetical protein CK203_098615 [Vitis vinifera]|uniref:Uncharacterized protein n=1 Tax=Vitis vinifera TaxID=29760 RepID=A0A438E4P1_VITVI|nr:hypothetical protein CK203_098615 [Vitis vinifera]
MRLALLQGKIEKGLYKLPTATRDVGHPSAFYTTSSTSDAGVGPIVSVDGARYFLFLVDDFSRFSWLYLLETKDGVFTYVLTFSSHG